MPSGFKLNWKAWKAKLVSGWCCERQNRLAPTLGLVVDFQSPWVVPSNCRLSFVNEENSIQGWTTVIVFRVQTSNTGLLNKHARIQWLLVHILFVPFISPFGFSFLFLETWCIVASFQVKSVGQGFCVKHPPEKERALSGTDDLNSWSVYHNFVSNISSICPLYAGGRGLSFTQWW